MPPTTSPDDGGDLTPDKYCEVLTRGPLNTQTGIYISNDWQNCRSCMTLTSDTQLSGMVNHLFKNFE
jgi:hypothetical protein